MGPTRGQPERPDRTARRARSAVTARSARGYRPHKLGVQPIGDLTERCAGDAMVDDAGRPQEGSVTHEAGLLELRELLD